MEDDIFKNRLLRVVIAAGVILGVAFYVVGGTQEVRHARDVSNTSAKQ